MAKRYYSYEETHRTVNGVKQKRCAKCKKWKRKSKSEFRKSRAHKDGLGIYCKGCAKAYERRHYRKDRKDVRRHLRYEQRHRIVDGVKQKLCCRCSKWKDKSHFYGNRRLKDGLDLYCKECVTKYARKCYEQKRQGARRNLRYQNRHRVVNRVKQKLCSKCGKWKAESEFYKDSSRKDGLTARCRKCSYKATNKVRKKRQLAVRD